MAKTDSVVVTKIYCDGYSKGGSLSTMHPYIDLLSVVTYI